MSNKQKFLTVLSLMIQPKVQSPKVAWTETEKHFEKNLQLCMELEKEELAAIMTYAIMGMFTLSEMHDNTLFHDIILDDMRTILHDRTCPKCKGQPDQTCGTEVKNPDDPQPGMRMFNNLDELLNAMRGKKPS